MTPSWIELAILVLGSYRITRLLGWDDFPPVADLRDRVTGAELDVEEPYYRRPLLEHFISCPFCLGFWVSLAVYVSWLSAERPTLYAVTPFAISGAVGLLAKNLDE